MKKLTIEQRAAFTEVLRNIRSTAYVSEQDEIITPKGQSGVFLKIKNGRLKILDDSGKTLFTTNNNPENIESFVKLYWYW